ncbi:O-antigen ligase family protein [Microbacterium sp. NPDC077184]|uniref:O-antigen ligase family protein n=1 Tax=Microbacterium sp. NPDC077184 TaxID=3154764 RepID=UPI003423D392
MSVDSASRIGTAPPDDLAVPAWRQVTAAVILAATGLGAALVLPPLVAGGLLLVVAVVILARRVLFSRLGLFGLFIAVLMIFPVRRYALPIPLPFALEPYRVLLLVLIVAVLGAVLVDSRRAWQPVGFGWPIGIFVASLVISIPANGDDLVREGLASTAAGSLLNYALLLALFYVTRQVITTHRLVLGLLNALVWSSVAVAFAAVIERVTRINPFLRLHEVLPLDLIATDSESFRAGGFRSFASSQHPIALSVMLCILIPIAIYLMRFSPWPRHPLNRRLVYGLAILIMLGGVLSAVSRTAIIVLAVMLLLALILRPWLGITLIAFSLPALLAGMLFVPRIVNTMLLSFLDLDALIASQQTSPGWRGAGRLADLGPAMDEFAENPLFGTGVGSRIVVGDDQNAFILDNQVLGTLLETGVVGVIGLAALFVVPAIMLLRWSFTVARDDLEFAMLGFALTVSLAGFCAAMFFYDAFGFYQTLFVAFMLLASGGWLITASPPALRVRADRERQLA